MKSLPISHYHFLFRSESKICLHITALNEALTAEVQRLKVATAELSGGDTSRFQQLSINPQMFQLRHHQATQITIHQLHHQQQSQQSNDDTSHNNESSE